jgi:hypothetical protein
MESAARRASTRSIREADPAPAVGLGRAQQGHAQQRDVGGSKFDFQVPVTVGRTINSSTRPPRRT